MENAITVTSGLNEETAKRLKEELQDEIQNIDSGENASHSQVEKKKVLIPDSLITQLVRIENALILSAVAKNCPDHVKQLASDAIKPTQNDIEVAKDFFQALVDEYAPNLLQGRNGGLWLAGCLYAANAGIKINNVSVIVQTHKGSK